MKKSIFILVGAALLLTTTTVRAQHSSKAAESKPSATDAQKSSKKAVTLLGQISADGKSFLSDNDDIWMISNPSILAGHEGHYVSLLCRATPNKNEIYVFSAATAVRNAKYVAKNGDAAFRR
jgi:hypothetical protein